MVGEEEGENRQGNIGACVCVGGGVGAEGRGGLLLLS